MNFSQSEKEYFARSGEPFLYDEIPVINNEEGFRKIIEETADGKKPSFQEQKILNLDLSGRDLRNMDFYRASFEKCNLINTDFSGSIMDDVSFYDSKITGMKLRGCNVRGASFRYHDMRDIDLSGANIYASVLEDATNQDKVITDEKTRWYQMSCPKEGAFIAWKCCTDLRVVMMLVPAEAKRCMATQETGRVSKVKVLSIKSIDESVSYEWAQSTVDPDFYYEAGKWIEPANGFQENRWKDSSPGIHFFIDRQQCVDYQSK